MILTGSEISKMCDAGKINIDSYLSDQTSSNNYNYRLEPRLGIPVVDVSKVSFNFINIPEEEYHLRQHIKYVGHTLEQLGSDTFSIRLIGRCLLQHYGLSLGSSNLGHTEASHQLAPEIIVAKPIIPETVPCISHSKK